MNIFNNPKGLAKNPLGILSLMISLIYGIACLVFSVGSKNLTETERLPLVYFIVVFPFIILFTLYQLVKNHHNKLYAPSDFQNEENFVNAFNKFTKTEVHIENTIKPNSTKNTISSVDVLESGKLELEERQNDLFETLKIFAFFLYKQKNELIRQEILRILPSESIEMLKYQEKQLLNNKVITDEEKLFS